MKRQREKRDNRCEEEQQQATREIGGIERKIRANCKKKKKSITVTEKEELAGKNSNKKVNERVKGLRRERWVRKLQRDQRRKYEDGKKVAELKD